MKPIPSSLAVACLLLTAGCEHLGPILTPANIERGAYTAANAAVRKYPQIKPELKIATDFICAAGNSTNISPEHITAELDKITTLSDMTVNIVNGGLLLYNVAYDYLDGDNSITNRPMLQADLQAVCNGFTRANSPPAVATLMRLKAYPVVRYK